MVGGTRIPYSKGGTEYPRGGGGGGDFLGYMEWRCQISWDAKYTVIPGKHPWAPKLYLAILAHMGTYLGYIFLPYICIVAATLIP